MAGIAFDANKDPDEVLDFTGDWTTALAGDTIVTSTFPDFNADELVTEDFPTPPLVKDSDSFDDGHFTIWLSGGAEGATYAFTNRITTAGGRTMDRTVKLKVKTK